MPDFHNENRAGKFFRQYPIVLLAFFALAGPIDCSAETVVETSKLILTFNDQGSLVHFVSCHPDCNSEDSRKLIIENQQGVVEFGSVPGQPWVQRKGLDGERPGNSRQLHFSSPDGQSISWKIPADGYLIEASTKNTGTMQLRAGPDFRARPAPGFGGWLEQVRYVAVGTDGIRQTGVDEEAPEAEAPAEGVDVKNEAVASETAPDTSVLIQPFMQPVLADWAGFRNRFWTVLVSGEFEQQYELQIGEENQEVLIRHQSPESEEQHLFYLGPVEARELINADEILGDLLYAGLWFWLRWICFALYYLLGWIHSFVPVWGLAIMLLSLTVNILMSPLSRMADRVQQQVNETEARLAPELSRIKKSCKGEEQANKILELYKSEGVHPLYSLKSMLGVALVIPVFIGAFDMLAENIYLLNTGFLWMSDISIPDAFAQLPFTLPFFGSGLNLLPFLMTGLSVMASWLHQSQAANKELRQRQIRNMVLMAIVFFVLFYTFPAGMVLYWTTNNLISVTKTLWKKR